MNRSLLRRLLNNWPAKIIALAAAVFIVIFNEASRLEERFMSVPLELELAEGLTPSSDVVDGVRIGLRGEPEAIFSIRENDVRAYVDLTEFDSEGGYRGPVRIERRGIAGSIEPLEITVEPLEVTVELEREQQKSVQIEPSLSGFLPAGYEMTQFRLNPDTVEIQGPRSAVREVEVIRTEDIALTGKREDFSVRVRLVRPDPLVTFPGGDVVEFQGIIEESVVLHTFDDLEIIVLGLDPAYQPAEPLPQGSIRVQARQAEIDAVRRDQARLVVNASTVEGPGDYTLSVRPEVPFGILVLRYEPTVIEVSFAEAQETPSGRNSNSNGADAEDDTDAEGEGPGASVEGAATGTGDIQ